MLLIVNNLITWDQDFTTAECGLFFFEFGRMLGEVI